MILINQKALKISNINKLPVNKKMKQSFSTRYKSNTGGTSEAISGVANIAEGMLFLQEVGGSFVQERSTEEFCQYAFKVLRNLQMDLLEGNIQRKHLYHLKDALEQSNFIDDTPELQELKEEIQLRLQVEIAKIEMNC